ncbi:D-alanyl-D-alanine carboxypeptidase family protein [Shouchella clausii]|uniref:D-alanyl-D-alanine carboxypeptidase family protein n=1 Tax=Shouchella clausii TaxID=79880 RepID=UPI002148EF00|nr:serine hydrolase [Shouchella clausii]MCR1290153.1 serine hydrolase [Shouchella clausii]MEB5473028.1 serine hydrolase [Shouchella clausii]WQG96325.1 serine hydrolase [Shouchella clausii]
MIIILLALFKVADRKEPFSFFRTDEYASPYIYVMDRETGRVVYEQNAEAKVYPASLTKIMTTIVALEQMDDLSAVAPVDVETYHEMFANNASMAGFFGREEVTYRDLLYGTMLTSGGEAANSLAVHVGGNVENFVQMMNDKAAELGLNGTHFTNPEGLHNEKQYTTASDMAKLLDYALNNNDFKTIFTAKTFQTTPTAEHPDGLLLQSTVLTFLHKEEQDRFDILGGKSGTTYEAGQCWATLGLVEDSEYISIVMGAPLKNISHPDRAQIADTLKLYRKIESSE